MDIEDEGSESGRKDKRMHSLSISSDSAFTKITYLNPNTILKKESLNSTISIESVGVARKHAYIHMPSTSSSQ